MTERPDTGHSADEVGVTDEVTPAPADDLVTDDLGTDDLNTEAVNDPAEDAESTESAEPTAPSGMDGAAGSGEAVSADVHVGDEHPDTALAAERLLDLQRLQAEYVNYKRRVDRDRALVQEKAIADVLGSMLPVMDDIHAAREHGDLTDGPFAAIAEKLEGSLGKFGLQRFGAVGETFDPTVHEALLHQAWDGSIEPADEGATTIVMVLQPGYRAGDQVIRPARVAVADPA